MTAPIDTETSHKEHRYARFLEVATEMTDLVVVVMVTLKLFAVELDCITVLLHVKVGRCQGDVDGNEVAVRFLQ